MIEMWCQRVLVRSATKPGESVAATRGSSCLESGFVESKSLESARLVDCGFDPWSIESCAVAAIDPWAPPVVGVKAVGRRWAGRPSGTPR
jgi:hypothetical protein